MPRWTIDLLALFLGLCIALGAFNVFAQGMPRLRSHTTTQSDGDLATAPANRNAPGTTSYAERVEGDKRIIDANGIPDHDVGRFPNNGNPNRISAQRYHFEIDAMPRMTSHVTRAQGVRFGIAVSGVVFDPFAAEFYRGQRSQLWAYEPLSGAIDLGVDSNFAHVQPDGSYHYHGIPTALLTQLGVSRDRHSPLVGWAADGFPIYAFYGHLNAADINSPVIRHTSSYRLKNGRRPGGGDNPGGYYDGTFTGDYEYVEDAGTLDECNGAWTVNADFPDGTYAYFITADWPVIPRCFKGTPSGDFRKGPGGMGGSNSGPRRDGFGGPGGRPPGPFGGPPERRW